MMTTQQVADHLSVSTRTLLRWRRDGIGPTHVTFPRKEGGKPAVRYRLDDVEAFVSDRKTLGLCAEHLETLKAERDTAVQALNEINNNLNALEQARLKQLQERFDNEVRPLQKELRRKESALNTEELRLKAFKARLSQEASDHLQQLLEEQNAKWKITPDWYLGGISITPRRESWFFCAKLSELKPSPQAGGILLVPPSRQRPETRVVRCITLTGQFGFFRSTIGIINLNAEAMNRTFGGDWGLNLITLQTITVEQARDTEYIKRTHHQFPPAPLP